MLQNEAAGRPAQENHEMQQRGSAPGGFTDDRADGGGRRPHVSVAGRRLPIPRSRIARIAGGALLILLGIFGFLPVLGFWMVPLGLLILSYDVPAARRLRRRIEVWWYRRRERKRGDGS